MKIFGLQFGRRKSVGETHKLATPADIAHVLTGGSMSAAGVEVSPERALYLSTVWACVRVLAETVGQLPLNLMRENNGKKEKAIGHPLYRALKAKPNHWQTPQEFKEFMTACLALRGNAYARISRGLQSFQLHPLMPAAVSPKRLSNGDVVYDVNEGDRGIRRYPADEILHLRLPAVRGDGLLGSSPVAHAREALGIAIATERHGANLFRNGARPGGVLTTDQELGEESIKNLRQSWQELYGGDNVHKVAVLEYGLKYQQIGLSSEDAQFLETRKFTRTELCGIWRVPPHMIGDLERATFSNIEHQGLDFVVHTMMPYLIRFEERLNLQCLTDEERDTYYAKFNVSALLRGDMTARGAFYTSMFNIGALSPNDIRELEDMNPRPGGDVYLTPANMVADPMGSDPESEPVDSAEKSP